MVTDLKSAVIKKPHFGWEQMNTLVYWLNKKHVTNGTAYFLLEKIHKADKCETKLTRELTAFIPQSCSFVRVISRIFSYRPLSRISSRSTWRIDLLLQALIIAAAASHVVKLTERESRHLVWLLEEVEWPSLQSRRKKARLSMFYKFRYYTSHTKTMLPTRQSVPRSSRQLDHMKISWRS